MKILPSSELPPVAILAGGLGTRMWPATEFLPKALLPVAGEPFLAHQLRALQMQGVTRVILCCGHFSEQIERFAGDGGRFALHVQYSHDGPTLLGTGGALRQALPLLGEAFFVLYGDSYLRVPFADAYAAYRLADQPALMTVLHNRGLWDASNAEVRDGLVVRYGKPSEPEMDYIDYGVGLYSAHVFHAWPEGASFALTELQRTLAAKGQMAAFEVGERFYEIGSPQGLAETEAYIRGQAARETCA